MVNPTPLPKSNSEPEDLERSKPNRKTVVKLGYLDGNDELIEEMIVYDFLRRSNNLDIFHQHDPERIYLENEASQENRIRAIAILQQINTRLSERQRIIFQLRAEQQLSFSEIAEFLDLSVRTIHYNWQKIRQSADDALRDLDE